MKTQRFDFKFTQLQLNVSMTLKGGVPGEQTYDAESGEYAPDFSLTPCVIQPTVGIIDRDRVLTSGCVNDQLSDMSWHLVVDGKEQSSAIVSTAKKYEITTSGEEKGKLQWYVNTAAGNRTVLRFRAKFLDTRTNQVFNVCQDFTIACKNATAYLPVVKLSAPEHGYYNPLRDEDTQVIKASLRLGSDECATSKRLFVWEILRSTGLYSAVTADDLEVSISTDGTTATVDRSLMGDQLTLRCRAKYSASGNPSAVALNDATPFAAANIVRRIPDFDYDFGGVPYNLDAGTRSFSPEAYISDNVGVISNPSRELLPLWYMATNKHDASLSYVLKGHGMNPVITTDLMDSKLGGMVGLDVKMLEPLALLANGDGKVIVNGDGSAIVFH